MIMVKRLPRDLLYQKNQWWELKRSLLQLNCNTRIFYALVDQTLFGEQPSTTRDTIAIFDDLKRQHTSWTHVDETHWHTRFNHLTNYGAGCGRWKSRQVAREVLVQWYFEKQFSFYYLSSVNVLVYFSWSFKSDKFYSIVIFSQGVYNEMLSHECHFSCY